MSFEINCYCLVVNISLHRIHIMESRIVLKCQHVGGIVQTQSFTERQRERRREGEKESKGGSKERKNETIGQKSAPSLCKNVI